jgi:hypothetical protein
VQPSFAKASTSEGFQLEFTNLLLPASVRIAAAEYVI